MTGRPSIFTQAVADAICERLADGRTLRSICEDEGMPKKSAVFTWLNQNTAFAEQYARAREAQADSLVDDMLDIADDARNDWMARHGEDDEGYRENGEAIRRTQLRIDARKWLAGKMRPKKYGDKVQLEHAGPDGKPLQIGRMTDAELEAIAAAGVRRNPAPKKGKDRAG